MKRLFVAISLACASLVSASALAQDAAPAALSVGVVDLQRALNEVDDAIEARNSLQADFNRRQAELDAAQEELATYAQELEASIAALTQEAAMERYAEYQQRVAQLEQQYAAHQQELAQAEAEATEGIVQRMIALAGTIAQERGYTLVLEKSTIVYAIDAYDFTDELISRFNAQ